MGKIANNRSRMRKKLNNQTINSQVNSQTSNPGSKKNYYDKFAKNSADYKSNLKGTQTSLNNITVSSVQNLFQNLESNYALIGSYMEALYKKNGIVSRTLNYLMSHPTYNYNIYPAFSEDSMNSMPQTSDFVGVSKYLEMYNIKFYAPYFFKQTLINGMSFFYEISNKDGVEYMEFPLSMCRIRTIENGVYRWMIDVTKIKQEMTAYLPNEIIKAYESTDKTDPKKWTDGKWYSLSNKGVAFCLDYSVMKNGGITVSEYAPLIIDSILVENAKSNVEIKDDIDAVRIIHAKIPLNKDGEPTITADQAGKWDKALKNNLPSGIVGITNPFELDNITLNGSGNSKAYDTVDDAQEQLFYSTGTPSALFGNNTTSSNIVKISVAKDAALIYAKLFPVLTSYYNYVLSNYKTANQVSWKLKMLEQSNFTKEEDVKRYKDAVSLGGSRTDYLASLGMTPLELYGKLLLEQRVLDIDSIMIPKQTSFTLSGKDQKDPSSDGAGRPTTDNPSDDTDRINDAQ